MPLFKYKHGYIYYISLQSFFFFSYLGAFKMVLIMILVLLFS